MAEVAFHQAAAAVAAAGAVAASVAVAEVAEAKAAAAGKLGLPAEAVVGSFFLSPSREEGSEGIKDQQPEMAGLQLQLLHR